MSGFFIKGKEGKERTGKFIHFEDENEFGFGVNDIM